MQQKLQAIQEEIGKLEKQLRTADDKLKIETQSIENIDRQIVLTTDKIILYKGEISVKENSIMQLEFQIDSLQNKIGSLQEVFKQQVVFAYKYQRGKHLDWLLGAGNFNQALLRYRYFHKVTVAEKSTYEQLQSLKMKLDSDEQTLKQEMNGVQKLLASASREERNLRDKHSTKEHLIRKINQNKSLLSRSLKEKKASYQKLRKLIASLEKSRSSRQLKPKTQIKWEKLSGSFSKNKKKFNWPVQGAILHKFGRFKNPKLKTVLNNTGIDIQAPAGSDVRCIFPGVVSLITYMSGFGNMLIIDHNDGYYSVYAHMSQINVGQDEFVEGALEGPKLHFEIYGNDRPLNPLDWLK
ncbi:MAG: peptidoglycan DD-metalloendopeptidase family protein [Calditrichia bacterium]